MTDFRDWGLERDMFTVGPVNCELIPGPAKRTRIPEVQVPRGQLGLGASKRPLSYPAEGQKLWPDIKLEKQSG